MDAWRHSGKLFWSALKEDTAYRRVVNPLQRSGDGRALNNISAWEEDKLYTAWLQDYKTGDKWQWQPRVR
jgi:hypothetical protein